MESWDFSIAENSIAETDMSTDATNQNASPPGISGGIRITIAVLAAIILGLFILLWDGQFIHYATMGIPHWVGPMIILPFMAVGVAFASNCLIQQLSCSKVQWLVQLERSAYSPIPIYAMWFLLYLIPGLRWPIEGMVQTTTPVIRTGLSSAFYTFWITMYSQGILNSLSQICPN